MKRKDILHSLPALASCGLAALVLTVSISGPINAAAENYTIFDQHPDTTRTWDGKWVLHDRARPQPPREQPKSEAELKASSVAPAGAVVLFDGRDLSAWEVPEIWFVVDGTIAINPVSLSLRTKRSFGSGHYHLEWKTPADSTLKDQNRGNSGLFLMGRYEIQILDTYENVTYADGSAGALYGMKPPDANPLRPPGEWQTYDIWFRRPTFDSDGQLLTAARVTVQINGVTVQNNVPFAGPTSFRKRVPYSAHADALPLELQYHNQIVQFRNVWVQTLADNEVISPEGPVGEVAP